MVYIYSAPFGYQILGLPGLFLVVFWRISDPTGGFFGYSGMYPGSRLVDDVLHGFLH